MPRPTADTREQCDLELGQTQTSTAATTTRFHRPLKPLHGEGQGLVELLDDAAGPVDAAVLQLHGVAVALAVQAGEARQLGGQQGGGGVVVMVGEQALRRGTLLGVAAQRAWGHRGGEGVDGAAGGHADHHLLGRQRRGELAPGHAGQPDQLARI